MENLNETPFSVVKKRRELILNTQEQKERTELESQKIALIENMSGLICPECGHRIDLFGSGGGKKQAEEMEIDFLGEIPINLEARKLADEGKSIILENKEADMSRAIFHIVSEIEKKYN